MLDKILNFSLKNRLLILFIAGILLVGGSYVATKMEIDVFPDLTAPSVVILTEAHGMATEEVERLVTFPIEISLNGATNVRRVRSSSATGISIVWVDFEWNTDVFKARQIVNEKLATVAEKLPLNAGAPTLAPQSSIIGEIMLITVSSDSISPMDLRTVSDWQIRNRLLSIGGVSQVIVMGGEYKQYQVVADPDKMEYYRVTLSELFKACENLNSNATGNFINDFGSEYVITGAIRTNNLDAIGNSVVKIHNGQPVSINDVAEVKIGSAPKIGAGYLNSKPAIMMTVLKQPNTNTVLLTEKIDLAIADLKKSLPAGISIRTDVFRQADFILRSVNNVSRALIEGGIFVVIILFIFLLNIRTTIISLVAIPLSLLVSVITLNLLGLTLNTMSLGGMAIAIGVLVDDAIIVVDNALKRLKLNARRPVEERLTSVNVILNASKEIMASIFNATIIIIVAFLPLFFLSGMEGRLLKPLGISFIVSLFASLVVALTLTPVMCSYLLTSEKQLVHHESGSRWVRWLNHHYGRTLTIILNYKKVIIGGSVALLIFALVVMSNLGRTFLPEFNEGMLTLSTVSLPGISLEESNKMNLMIEEEMLAMPEIETITRRTGRAELDEHAQGVFSSEVDVPFTLADRSKDEFLTYLRARLSTIRGINITVGQPLSHRIDHMISGTRANIAIKVFGTDLQKMFSIASQIRTDIQEIDGLVDVNVEQQVDIPQLQIKPRREMLKQYGIPVNEFAEYIDIAFAGEKVSEVYEDNMSFDLVLIYNNKSRNSIEGIKNSLIDTYDGRKVPLKEIADIVSATGPNTISRENVQRKVVISANVSGRDLRGVVNDVQKTIKEKIALPENYYIEYGGQFESEEKASGLLLSLYIHNCSICNIYVIVHGIQEYKDVGDNPA